MGQGSPRLGKSRKLVGSFSVFVLSDEVDFRVLLDCSCFSKMLVASIAR